MKNISPIYAKNSHFNSKSCVPVYYAVGTHTFLTPKILLTANALTFHFTITSLFACNTIAFHALEELCLCTIRSVWNKTTLITGGVEGANPTSVKWGHFLLCHWHLGCQFQKKNCLWM